MDYTFDCPSIVAITFVNKQGQWGRTQVGVKAGSTVTDLLDKMQEEMPGCKFAEIAFGNREDETIWLDSVARIDDPRYIPHYNRVDLNMLPVKFVANLG